MHTPGPWELIGTTLIGKTGPHSGAVAIIASPTCKTSGDAKEADCDDPRWDEAMANARLIAAAPELLEACKAAKKYLEPDLVEPGRTVFWKLVEAIAEAS